jgi:hypothetical protein
VRPPTLWEDPSGIEIGGRLEWRWRRFSFALTDYWGYSDIPFLDPIFDYERNVDPRTGRPRFANVRAGCDPERLFDGDTSGCLASPRGERVVAAPDSALDFPGRIPANRDRFLKSDDRNEVLRKHHVNQTLFHTFCASTVGFTDLLPGLENECVFNIFSSQARVDVSGAGIAGGLPIVELAGLVLGGSNTTLALAQVAGLELTATLPFLPPLVPLNARDPRTGEGRVRTSLLLGGTLAFVPISNLASLLTPEQQALVGCGVFYGTSCDNQGVDLMNAEAGVLLESFPGFDGTPLTGFTSLRGPQPGTLGFDGGRACTRFEQGRAFVLPGCRGPEDPGYDPRIDGVPIFAPRPVEPLTTATPLGDITGFNTQAAIVRAAAGIPQCGSAVVGDRLFHPFTCDAFRSELSALSFNLLMVAVIISQDTDDDGFAKLEDFDEFDPARPFADDRCSFAAPQFCSVVRGLFGASGVGRQDLRAGGNGRFGRRDFLWHGSREGVLRYQKRNVLGFSADFAEDVTKTNWSLEFTWFSREIATDRDSPSGTTDVDTFNLTISMDRPTFVNFLNANRTLFFNMQLFLSYVPDHTDAFSAQGPVNALGTFTVLTGYFQDRLLSVMTLVYDVQSNSGAVLPNFVYRFNQNFSVQVGLAYFFGGFDFAKPFVNPIAVQNRVGNFAYNDFVENGLSIIRQRDEVFARLRWTF